MKNKKLSSETVISVSAIIIALVSIIVAIWQGVETRKHNRLSVQPRLDLAYSLDYDNGLAKFTIKNNGLGPAIFDNASASINGDNYNLNDPSIFFAFLKRLGIDSIPVTFDNIEFGSTLMPNELLNIFMVEIKSLDEQEIDARKLLNNVKIKIRYKSLYDEDFIVKQ